MICECGLLSLTHKPKVAACLIVSNSSWIEGYCFRAGREHAVPESRAG